MSDAVTSDAPSASAPSRSPMPFPDASRRSAMIVAAIPIGTLIRKIACQLTTCVNVPPSRSPIEPPAAAVKLKTPIAFARSSPSSNIVTIIARITEDAMAPPSPCTKRAATKSSRVHATPQSSDASVNVTRPAIKTRLLPIKSPRRPASSNRPPNAIMYALTTQARLDCEKPRSLWIDGSATFTTVLSSTIINMPTQRTTREIQRTSRVDEVGADTFRASGRACC